MSNADLNNISISNTTSSDYRATEELIRECFWNVYRPGCVEHYLIHTLRNNTQYYPDLDFVMKLENEIVGQIIYFPAEISDAEQGSIDILTFGPVCIKDNCQKKGFGTKLINDTLKIATDKGYSAVCIEGNYDFYSKCGFRYATDFGLRYKGVLDGEDVPFFLCRELSKGFLDNIIGEYSSPTAYLVDDKEVEEFDKSFPKAKKLKLPSQIF